MHRALAPRKPNAHFMQPTSSRGERREGNTWPAKLAGPRCVPNLGGATTRKQVMKQGSNIMVTTSNCQDKNLTRGHAYENELSNVAKENEVDPTKGKRRLMDTKRKYMYISKRIAKAYCDGGGERW